MRLGLMRCTLAAHATGHCAPWPLGPRVHACCCRRRWPCREPVDTPHSCADPNEFVLSMCIPPPFLSQGFALYFHKCQPQQVLPLLPARQGDHTIARPGRISLASSCSALGFLGLDLGFEDLGLQWVCVKCRGAIQSEGLGWCSSFPVLCIRGSGQPFIPRQEKFSYPNKSPPSGKVSLAKSLTIARPVTSQWPAGAGKQYASVREPGMLPSLLRALPADTPQRGCGPHVE